jgi:hypothetical protein
MKTRSNRLATQNGIYFLVGDSVSCDNSNLFKDYQKALNFYYADDDGTDGEYHVQLSAVYVEDGLITESIEIKSKLVRDNKTVYQNS